ncbi:MAG: purine-cytosine permease family protein [Acidimicrobiales bacterium]
MDSPRYEASGAGGVASGAGGVATAPAVAAIEQRGIDYVPPRSRWGRPVDLFWMWAGAIVNIEFVVYGTLIIAAFKLSFEQALIVIVIGNLFYLLTGVLSLQGPQAGTTAFTISRAPFGIRGNRVLAIFNWLTQVGFETEGVALVVLAGLALATKAGYHPGTPLKVALIIIAAAIQLVLPLLGHSTIMRVLRILTFPFIALFIILAILTTPKVNLSAPHLGANWETMLVAVVLVISAGGLGWTENANDYSRYLPRSTSQGRVVWWVFLGGFIPSVLLEVLGAAVATGVPSSTDPISGLPHAFPSWFLVPYLIVAIVQLFCINTIDLYSSGVTLQSIGLKLKRVHCVLIDTVVCCGLTAYAIFSSSFSTLLSDFLSFIIIWLGPWAAIYLVDWLLRGGRYDVRSLFARAGGLYWRHGGANWPGLVAQLVGMVAAAMWINTLPFSGPLSTLTNGADLSIYMGIVFGGVIYFVLARGQVRREAAATPAGEPDLAGLERVA